MKNTFIKLLMVFLTTLAVANPAKSQSCKCDYTVEPAEVFVDGSKLQLAPGSTVCIKAGKKRSLKLVNFSGAPGKYIRFINTGGQVFIQNTDFHYGLSIENSRYFRLTGTGFDKTRYGIKIEVTTANASALSIGELSTDYEIDNIEVSRAGFAGIMSKTDPRCDGSSNRGRFVQQNVSFHDNFIHDVKGEGMYVGNSFYTGFKTNCAGKSVTLFPHDIRGVKIYNNIIQNTGWDGIQVGCAVADCEIYSNTISIYGLEEVNGQMSGIQINSGTVGKCYNNMIKNGKGHGIVMFGLGDNICYNNVIINPGKSYAPGDESKAIYGIFCDDRGTIAGKSFCFVNNTIINPKTEGIRMMSMLSNNNKVCNNIIIHPGATAIYAKNKFAQDPYINVKKGVRAVVSNNYCDTSLDKVRFANPAKDDYTPAPGSPAIDSGLDLPDMPIVTDFYSKKRKSGNKCDIGACEFSK